MRSFPKGLLTSPSRDGGGVFSAGKWDVMITLQSKTRVAGISGRAILEFLLNATDGDYQRWWPGVHLQLHTIRRHPDNIGNVVYMDEFVGRYRLNATGVVVEVLSGKKIVWQFKKGFRLPVWLSLAFDDDAAGVSVTHTVRAGFGGLGRILDPIFRVYFSAPFAAALDEHVKVEFPRLRDLLTAHSPTLHRTEVPAQQSSPLHGFDRWSVASCMEQHQPGRRNVSGRT
jgi:hypothetical protein